MPETANELLQKWVLNRELVNDARAVEIAQAMESLVVNDVLPNIAEQIGNVPWQSMTTDKVRLFQLQQIIREGLPIDRMRDGFLEGLTNMAVEDARAFIETLQSVLPVSIQTAAPSPEQMLALVTETPFNGQLMGKWFDKWPQSEQARLMQQFKIGITEGKTIPELGKMLADGSGMFEGTAKAIARNSQAVARTATTLVNARARELTYAQNEDVISGVEYLATLDDKTTAICMELDGKVFPIGEGPRPPQHWNCRSTTVPAVKSWEELGIPAQDATESTRASLNGQVPESTTGSKWLKGQDAAIQNKVLGVKRGELFRTGQADLKDMIRPNGSLKTLSELRREGFDLGKQAVKSVKVPKVSATTESIAPKATQPVQARKLNLTANEKNNINYYTGDGFKGINADLRVGSMDRFSGEIKAIDSGLNKIPSTAGQFNRTVNFDTRAQLDAFIKTHTSGSPVVYNEYLSTSKGSFYGGKVGGNLRVNMEIIGKNGKSISQFSRNATENEFLFPRGSKFTVETLNVGGGKYGETLIRIIEL